MKKTRLITTLLLPVTLILTFIPLLHVFSQSSSPQLRLHRDNFVTSSRYQVDEGIMTAPYAIIQFPGPISLENRKAVAQTGVTIIEYLPEYAYLVRGTETQLQTAVSLPQVYAAYPFTPLDKLAPSLLKAWQNGETHIGPLRIIGWSGEVLDANLNASLRDLPFAVQADITQSQLLQIAGLEAVRWIEPAARPRILNDAARNIMNVNATWQETQLFGQGQTLGIADSGLDTGSMATLSPDFSGRVVATHALAPGGNWADEHGHGTHVAGSAVGAGIQSGANPAQQAYASSFAGLAPQATLVVQGFEVEASGEVAGIPEDYYQLFQQAYNSGARLHSNSWGDVTGPISDTEAAYGGYPYGAQRTDTFVWNHPDMTIFAAAGNSGTDGDPGPLGLCVNGDGVIDPDSLVSPGTAKNVITVGATESNKDEGPLQGIPWFLLNLCFIVDPILSDVIANNVNGMAAFSSRGPTDDGRFKPDIAAPGTNIISNRSHMAGATTLWGEHNADYVYSGGTSMATPLTAGLGVLTRQWLKLQGSNNPSAALVKATLLNSTQDIAPGQYGTGAAQEIPDTRPNSVAGWGRADAGFMNPPPNYRLWFDDHTQGLQTAQAITYTHTLTHPLQVLTHTMPLQLMLVWTDPPASLSAAAQLVNDLDLIVTGPGNSSYYGNGVVSGDRSNNVEGIIIENPTLGEYQITVTAFNIPIADQPYALVVAGPLGDSPDLPPPPEFWIYLPAVLQE